MTIDLFQCIDFQEKFPFDYLPLQPDYRLILLTDIENPHLPLDAAKLKKSEIEAITSRFPAFTKVTNLRFFESGKSIKEHRLAILNPKKQIQYEFIRITSIGLELFVNAYYPNNFRKDLSILQMGIGESVLFPFTPQPELINERLVALLCFYLDKEGEQKVEEILDFHFNHNNQNSGLFLKRIREILDNQLQWKDKKSAQSHVIKWLNKKEQLVGDFFRVENNELHSDKSPKLNNISIFIIAYICGRLGLTASFQLGLRDKNTLQAISKSVSWVKNEFDCDFNHIETLHKYNSDLDLKKKCYRTKYFPHIKDLLTETYPRLQDRIEGIINEFNPN